MNPDTKDAVANTVIGATSLTGLGALAKGALSVVQKTAAEMTEKGLEFVEHMEMRAGLGLQAGEGTLAKLEAGGQEFWGINAHGQPVPLRVNPISATHAEADAFSQAARAGVNGGPARLIVDRPLCQACGTFGAVRSMARQLGIDLLEIITPAGRSTIIP